MSGWPVPGVVRARGGVLGWHLTGAAVKTAEAGADLLERFGALASAEPERVESFARTFGVLGRPDWFEEGEDDLDAWRAGGFDSVLILRIARLLAEHRPVSAALWMSFQCCEPLYLQHDSGGRTERGGIESEPAQSPDDHVTALAIRPTPGSPITLASSEMRTPRAALAYIVDGWMAAGPVSVGFGWPGGSDKGGMVLRPGCLVGAVGLLLGEAVGSILGLVECSACGSMFDPEVGRQRRPRRGFRAYCTVCRESGVAARDSERRSRSGQR